MGAWGELPWEADSAVDFFDDFFGGSEFSEIITEYLAKTEATERNHEEVRSVTTLVLFLCRAYVWPIESLDQTLELAAKRLREIEKVDIIQDYEDFAQAVRHERMIIEARLSREEESLPPEVLEYWKRMV
ncbi:hypothetical protein KQI84_06835 [bacterium]|nr:hypothetical protein [bacterium]